MGQWKKSSGEVGGLERCWAAMGEAVREAQVGCVPEQLAPVKVGAVYTTVFDVVGLVGPVEWGSWLEDKVDSVLELS